MAQRRFRLGDAVHEKDSATRRPHRATLRIGSGFRRSTRRGEARNPPEDPATDPSRPSGPAPRRLPSRGAHPPCLCFSYVRCWGTSHWDRVKPSLNRILPFLLAALAACLPRNGESLTHRPFLGEAGAREARVWAHAAAEGDYVLRV